MRRLLIVDRDGVINQESPSFIKHPNEWVPLPGSLRALGQATQAGFDIFVASNQSGLARRHLGVDDLNHIHTRLLHEAAPFGARIEAFFFCPHGPNEGCHCRKPQPGLLLAIGARSGLPLVNGVMIGDRASDLAAARAANIKPVLVLTGHGQATAKALREEARCPTFADLASAVQALVSGAL